MQYTSSYYFRYIFRYLCCSFLPREESEVSSQPVKVFPLSLFSPAQWCSGVPRTPKIEQLPFPLSQKLWLCQWAVLLHPHAYITFI